MGVPGMRKRQGAGRGGYEGSARILEHFDDKGLPGIRMRRYAETTKFRSNAPDGRYQASR